MSGITAIPLVTVIATILSVDGQHARLDAGLAEGLRPDDYAVVYYMTEIGAERKKVVVSRGVIVEVADHRSMLRVESEFTVLPGYSVELEVPMSRVAPMSILELARSRLMANRSGEALRSLLEVVVPDDEFVEQQIVQLIEDRRRRRGAGDLRTRPTVRSAEGSEVSSEMAALARDWAQAWADQRIDDYLAFYSRGFLAQDGMTRRDWEAQRRRRIERPRFIKLSLELLDSGFIDSGRGWIRFRQSYWSNSFHDVVVKKLELIHEDGGWKILQETVS